MKKIISLILFVAVFANCFSQSQIIYTKKDQGRTLLTGVGTPTINAVTGNQYVNSTTGEVYQAINNVWSISTSTFRSYIALLSQASSNAPVATVIYNDLGFTPTFSWNTNGLFECLSSAGFTDGKTVVMILPDGQAGWGMTVTAFRSNSSTIEITSGDESGVGSNDYMTACVFMIYIYN